MPELAEITIDQLAMTLTNLGMGHAALAELVGKQNAWLIEVTEQTALLQKGLSELREQLVNMQIRVERLEAAQNPPALH